MAPRVSVIIPSFNHAAFIKSAVESVLTQTLQELEVIIVDDGSADCSAQIIGDITDSRARSILLGKNQGACEALNIGIRESKAPLIAICNSDDEWLPQKLALQLRVLESNPRLAAVFSDVFWIDEHGDELEDKHIATAGVFQQTNRSRAAWLRDLVQGRNCLCHPSVLIRRDIYHECGLYDNCLRQLPDYNMWLSVLEKYPIHVLSDKLVRFRVCTGQENASAPTPSNLIRDRNEQALILRRFFKRIGAETFAESFGTTKALSDPEFSFALEKSLYLAKQRGIHTTLFHDIAIEILYEFLQEHPDHGPILDSYGLPSNVFHIVTGIFSPWHSRELLGPLTPEERRFLDTFELPARTCATASTEINTIQLEKSSNHQIEVWHELKRELAEVLNSTSWRVTRPLREIKSYLNNHRPQPKS